MGYCDVTALRAVLAPLAGPSPHPPEPPTQTAADLSDPQLQDAIDQASSLVDVAIGARYVVPVAAVSNVFPHPIDWWARDIAAYLATCTHRGSVDFTNDDPIYRRYVTSMSSLNDIKTGIGVLDLPVVSTSTGTAAAAGVVNPYTGTLFTADDFDLVPMTRPPGIPRWWDL